MPTDQPRGWRSSIRVSPRMAFQCFVFMHCQEEVRAADRGGCWQWGLQAAEAAPALPGLSSPHVFSKARTTLEK